MQDWSDMARNIAVLMFLSACLSVNIPISQVQPFGPKVIPHEAVLYDLDEEDATEINDSAVVIEDGLDPQTSVAHIMRRRDSSSSEVFVAMLRPNMMHTAWISGRGGSLECR
jgi:hypothetical protein